MPAPSRALRRLKLEVGKFLGSVCSA